MKNILQLVVMAALVASVGVNAAKHCVTKKNEHGVMVTTCHKDHNINKKRTCVTKVDADGKKVTTCKGTVRKTH